MDPKKQLDEKIQTGGGATGVAHTADPVDKKATLPASHLGNGEGMNKIADVTPGQGEEETSTENNTKPTKDTAGSNKATVAMNPSAASASMKEDVDALLQGQDLSEEFKEKATVIFEAAVTARVNQIAEDLETQYNTALEQEVTSLNEQLTEKIDQYMNYVAEQFMEENKVAIEHSLRTEITEQFIEKLKGLFEESYISVPQEKFDVVEAMQEEMQEIQQKLDEALEANIALMNQVNESVRKDILSQVAEGLAATQAEKLASLAEGVNFDSAESYRKKLEIVKENYFPSDKPASKTQNLMEQVDEEAGVQPKAPTNSPVSIYAQAISRTVKK